MEDKWFSSEDGRFQFRLPASHIQTMLTYCTAAQGKETGGILVGYYTTSQDCAMVTDISGPPADSRAQRQRFFRGTRGLKRWLQALWGGPRHYYLGEWHYHPDAESIPSGEDRTQMLQIAGSKAYACPEPLLIIIGGNPQAAWTLSAHVFTAAGQTICLTERHDTSPL